MHTWRPMKLVPLCVLATLALAAQSGPSSSMDAGEPAPSADLNVNSRYMVESIDFYRQGRYRLSNSLLEEMQHLVGQRLNSETINRLATQICGELRAHSVTFRLARGQEPDHVKVLFDVDKRGGNFDLSIPRFSYNSKLGLSGSGEIGVSFGANKITVGLLSDIDNYVAREAGITAKYTRSSVGSDRVSLNFEFDSFHEQYAAETMAALSSPKDSLAVSSLGAGAYRSRTNFEPSAAFVLAEPLTLTVGLSFDQLQPQLSAARSDSVSAVINTLRYHRRWEDSDTTKQDLEAGYSLRAATRSLGGTLAYTRHQFNAGYRVKREHQSVEVALVAGLIYGNAPLFERFVLGNSTTLRGWSRYDLDPLGGNRMIDGSVTYGYRIMRVFYDTGSVWDQSKGPELKQSVGAGVTSGLGLFRKDMFLLALAFPIRQGRMEPVFITGMNF
jgi:outer membrane protein assembly factor BamA